MKLELSYRDILRTELAERISENPAYSLRALAKHAGVSPSLMSAVLSGKKGLSSSRAMEVGQALHFEGTKLEYFVTLVQIEETSSPKRKDELCEKLTFMGPQQRTENLNLDVFRMIYDWYHSAILELTRTSGFTLTAKSAAGKLGISEFEAEAAIQRLSRLELLKTSLTGHLVQAENDFLTTSSVPNSALRNYHAQMLKKASEALAQQTPQEKIVGSETLAFDQKDLKEANLIIEECFAKLVSLAASKKKKRDVYHLGIQFFRLTKKESSL